MGGDSEQDFKEYWGWKVTLDELTDGDPLKEDLYLDWPYIRFLNELSFRKEKNFITQQKLEEAWKRK